MLSRPTTIHHASAAGRRSDAAAVTKLAHPERNRPVVRTAAAGVPAGLAAIAALHAA